MAARVDGVTAAQQALRSAGEELADMSDAYADVANTAADVMRGFMPVRTGHARDSIRPERADGAAIVTAGGPSAPYVPALAATHPSRFVPRMDAVMEQRTAERLEREWDTIATRNGLS